MLDAARILVLERGRLIETGTHAELVAAGGNYASLIHRQLLSRRTRWGLVGLQSLPGTAGA